MREPTQATLIIRPVFSRTDTITGYHAMWVPHSGARLYRSALVSTPEEATTRARSWLTRQGGTVTEV